MARIQEEKSLAILSAVEDRRNRSTNLPTWVPRLAVSDHRERFEGRGEIDARIMMR